MEDSLGEEIFIKAYRITKELVNVASIKLINNAYY